MSRELPGYRDCLEDILSFSQGRRLLTVGEVCQYTGLTDRRTARRHFPIENGYISAMALARALSDGGRRKR